MSRGRRLAESGQVLPWAVFALAAGALLALFVARAGMMLERRIRLQSSVDATALSAATAYARGLNIVAASNQLLFAAALSDAAIKMTGAGAVVQTVAHLTPGAPPASFTSVVMTFQDVWAGTSGGYGAAGSAAGIAPAGMEAIAMVTGSRNGLAPVVLWNRREGPSALAPDLNLRRASTADLAAWLAGAPAAGAAGKGPGQVTVSGTRERDQYSYQPRAGGPRVVLSPEEAERITFEARQRVVTASREAARRGPLAGRFLKKEKVLDKVARTFDLPLPLIEREPAHEVLVVARAATSDGAGARWFPLQTAAIVSARADVAGGEVFNALYGNPSFEARLTPVGGGSTGMEAALALLANPAAWASWAAGVVRSAAISMARNAVTNAIRSRLPFSI